jgi:hypothetical protein
MKKAVDELVWPVDHYTDKISANIELAFKNSPHLTFTREQLLIVLKHDFSWLVANTPHQELLLSKLINLYTKRLIQAGKVKRVISKVSVDHQWMWAGGISETVYINVTSDDEVAHTAAAHKEVNWHPLSAKHLRELNRKVTQTDMENKYIDNSEVEYSAYLEREKIKREQTEEEVNAYLAAIREADVNDMSSKGAWGANGYDS